MPGDDLVTRPSVVSNHAITIDARPDQVWPWLVQMGWHRGGWYTARWVDECLFPENWPSACAIMPEFQVLRVGDFVPDGPPALSGADSRSLHSNPAATSCCFRRATSPIA